MSRYLTWRRRRALGRAARAVLAVPVRHPRAVAGPGIALGVLAVGAALRLIAPWWQVLLLATLLAVPVAVHTVRAALPSWRRAARWVAVAAGVATAAAGWWWAVLVLGLAVAVAVVELPRFERVGIVGDDPLTLPAWARPGVLGDRLRRSRARRAHRPAVTGGAARPRTRAQRPPTVRETVPETVAPSTSLLRTQQRETVETKADRRSETVSRTVPLDDASVVRELLADGRTAAPVELYRATGVSRATFHRRATEYIAQGWLVRTEGGYRLAEPLTDDTNADNAARTQPPGAEFRTLPR